MGTRINGGNKKNKISFETLILVPKCPQPKWKKGGGGLEIPKKTLYQKFQKYPHNSNGACYNNDPCNSQTVA